jgi:uncharacterized protein
MARSTLPSANDNAELSRKCPICNQASQLSYKPFCSKRCADVDLNRWLKGSYAIPVTEVQENTEEDR